MNKYILDRDLPGFCRGKILLEEPLSRHTTWRIGGPADVLVEPADLDDLIGLLKYAREKCVSVTVVGCGSNLLVTDDGVEGIVIKLSAGFSEIRVDQETVAAGGGVRLSRLASAARDSEVGGFSFLAGIPGTVGGAVVMNAGASGFSTGDLVEVVDCVDCRGRFLSLGADEIQWSYRKSSLSGKGLIVVGARLKGHFLDRERITSEMEKMLIRRRESQPLEYPSCGSVFKNPPGLFAGRLIEEAGCKGMRLGGAQVSEKHANFIINLGESTAVDVLSLIDAVREKVLNRFGVDLETEVEILGRH